MVLPGIQALFSFQMIAVFNNGFTERLWLAEQKLHIASSRRAEIGQRLRRG